jgi:hypothetical protein
LDGGDPSAVNISLSISATVLVKVTVSPLTAGALLPVVAAVPAADAPDTGLDGWEPGFTSALGVLMLIVLSVLFINLYGLYLDSG